MEFRLRLRNWAKVRRMHRPGDGAARERLRRGLVGRRRVPAHVEKVPTRVLLLL